MEKEDKFMKELLQEGFEQSGPRMDFTSNVMRAIDDKVAKRHKPIIGKIGWLIIGGGFTAFIVYLFINTDLNNFSNHLAGNYYYVVDLLNNGGSYVALFAICIIVFFILADNFWRKRKRTSVSS